MTSKRESDYLLKIFREELYAERDRERARQRVIDAPRIRQSVELFNAGGAALLAHMTKNREARK